MRKNIYLIGLNLYSIFLALKIRSNDKYSNISINCCTSTPHSFRSVTTAKGTSLSKGLDIALIEQHAYTPVGGRLAQFIHNWCSLV